MSLVQQNFFKASHSFRFVLRTKSCAPGGGIADYLPLPKQRPYSTFDFPESAASHTLGASRISSASHKPVGHSPPLRLYSTNSISLQKTKMFWGGQQFAGRSYFGRPHEREPEAPTPSQWFKLSDDCLLALHRGDITKWFVDMKKDAIVNAANELMLGGGGVDGAIHRAAGPELYRACKAVPQVEPGVRCPTGEAVLTPGFRLPAFAVVHTVGPIYQSRMRSEPALVASYRNSILRAAEAGLQYLAFPAISCGVYGYPYDEGARVALTTCKEHADQVKEIHFVLFERPAWTAWLEAAQELKLPPTTVDEDARKAAKKQALEERVAALQQARNEGGGAMSERSPRERSPQREAEIPGGKAGPGMAVEVAGVEEDTGMEERGGDEGAGATGWGEQEAGESPNKRGASSSGSFETGGEEFEDNSSEGGNEGKVLKRVRSEDGYVDALEDGWAKDVSEPEGWTMVENPTSVSGKDGKEKKLREDAFGDKGEDAAMHEKGDNKHEDRSIKGENKDMAS